MKLCPIWAFARWLIVVGAVFVAATASAADPMDWPNWRGPDQNRVTYETGLIDQWNPETGENVLWKNTEAAGICSPIVLNGKVYLQVRYKPDTKQEQEEVICVDANTGKTLWENRWNVYLSDVPAERIGWSSVVGDPETGRIYSQGVNGYFSCIDGETGKTIWSRSLGEQFGMISPYGGRTHPPALFEDLVIINGVMVGWGDTAPPAHRILALNKNTGEPIWFSHTKPLPEDTIFSTPFFTVLDGEAAMVVGSSDGAVWAFQPRTGKPIWNFRMSPRGLSPSPVVVGDKVYESQAEETLDRRTAGSLTCFKGTGHGDITKTNEIWTVPKVMAGKSSPVVFGDRVYSADDTGNLWIVNAETGTLIGKPVKLMGTIVRATPLCDNGKIYICSTTGWHVLEPTQTGVKFLAKMRLPENDEVSGSLAASHGKIYLPTGSGLYCLGEKNGPIGRSTADVPAPAKEKPVGDDTNPACVQVTPCELLLKPGEKQQFKATLFNDHGQAIAEQPATFTLDGPGQIDAKGNYTAPDAHSPAATIVTAKVGDVTGQARIRIVPPLPWKFDFNDTPLASNPAKPDAAPEGEAPLTWIGARHRHKVREIDGDKVMVKITTIPKGTRSQCWMGPDDLHDYTVQADLRGANNNGQLPDMGLIAQRYTLDMMGNSQQLQIRSWPPQVARRFSQTIPFAWKGDTWYTMKFQASTEDGKAHLRGKVWPRGESEPQNWTIEAVDDVPNLEGSPGLFGQSTVAEIYIDNVAVAPNEPQK